MTKAEQMIADYKARYEQDTFRHPYLKKTDNFNMGLNILTALAIFSLGFLLAAKIRK